MRFRKRQVDPNKDILELLRTYHRRITALERELASLHRLRKETEIRVGVFVDVQNVFYGAKKEYNARLDFGKLLPFIVGNRRLVIAYAYVIENPDIDQKGFFQFLDHRSYTVKRKELIRHADGTLEGDWDMEIALDMIELAGQLDVIALVSGDGDFVPVLKRIKLKGPKIEVYGFTHNTAADLKEVADVFVPIPRELMLQKENTHVWGTS